MKSNTQSDQVSKSRDLLVVSALMLLTLVTRAAFIYRNGMGDPDSMVMATGMVSGLASETSFGDTLLYGRQANPGMYFITYLFYPLVFDTPSRIVAFLNWLNVISFTLLVWPLYYLFRKHLAAPAAAGSILLFAFSPLVWESGTYFHPLVPSCLLFFLAILAWQRIELSRRGIFYLVLCYVLSAAAFLIRVEILFVTPALFVWTFLSERKKRNALLFSALCLLVLATYLLTQRALTSPATAEHHGLRPYISSLYHLYLRNFSLPGVARSSVWAVLSIGVGTFGLICWPLVRRMLPGPGTDPSRAGDSGRMNAVALVWILPSFVFWLPQPVPIMRHFLLAALGLSWLAGATALACKPARALGLLVLTAVLANILVPELIYRSYNASNPTSAKVPHGAFFYYHQKTTQKIARYRQLQTELAQIATGAAAAEPEGLRPGALVCVDWEGYAYVLYGLLTSSPGLKKLSVTTEYFETYMHRYDVGGVEIRILHSQRFASEPARDKSALIIQNAKSAGFRVYAPTEVLEAGLADSAAGIDIFPY